MAVDDLVEIGFLLPQRLQLEVHRLQRVGAP
jgi:hypothetical protein